MGIKTQSLLDNLAFIMIACNSFSYICELLTGLFSTTKQGMIILFCIY